jgi:hypothetical protein
MFILEFFFKLALKSIFMKQLVKQQKFQVLYLKLFHKPKKLVLGHL